MKQEHVTYERCKDLTDEKEEIKENNYLWIYMV